MKNKLLYLLLALTMCVSLTACGGGDNTASTASSSAEDSAEDTVEDTVEDTTDDSTEALTEAYNQVAVLYNDVTITAQENGWDADEETVEALGTIGAILDPIGQALTGDMSALEGADFGELADGLLELVPDLEALSEKVSVPYGDSAAGESSEGEGAGDSLQLLTDTYNQVATFCNDVTIMAVENGWDADEETVEALGTISAILEPIGEALSGDMSALEGADLDDLANGLLELVPDLETLSERVSVPYEG